MESHELAQIVTQVEGTTVFFPSRSSDCCERIQICSAILPVTLPVNNCLAIEARARIPFLIAMIQDLSHSTADMGSSLLVRERYGQQRHGRSVLFINIQIVSQTRRVTDDCVTRVVNKVTSPCNTAQCEYKLYAFVTTRTRTHGFSRYPSTLQAPMGLLKVP